MRMCRIWVTDNGYGLTRDRDIIVPMVQAAGFRAEVSSPNRPAKGKTDIGIHLEHIHARNMELAPVNVAIPNVEWCPPSMVSAMRRCSHVIAKTDSAAYFLRSAGIESINTGWTSPDMLDASVERRDAMCLIAGRSPLKNTAVVLKAMALLPDLELALYRPATTPGVPPNVTHFREVIPPASMRSYINAHRIHVLPSQYEGFGHMLNEAASCGAQIVTVDHEPMRIFDDRYLCPVASVRKQHLATLAMVTPEALAETIRKAWDDKVTDGEAIRLRYLQRDATFRAKMQDFLNAL